MNSQFYQNPEFLFKVIYLSFSLSLILEGKILNRTLDVLRVFLFSCKTEKLCYIPLTFKQRKKFNNGKTVDWWYEINNLASVAGIYLLPNIYPKKNILCCQILLEIALNKEKVS